jgi:hypothetical protein
MHTSALMNSRYVATKCLEERKVRSRTSFAADEDAVCDAQLLHAVPKLHLVRNSVHMMRAEGWLLTVCHQSTRRSLR